MFANLALAPLWTVARLYLGWQWLQADWHKVDGDGWLNQDGVALQGFWERIVAVPKQGRPPINYGIALIMGVLTGIAALGGAFMNFNFMLAGSASTNPVLFLLAILMLLTWGVSGHIGIDRWLLALLHAPWQPRPSFLTFEGLDSLARQA